MVREAELVATENGRETSDPQEAYARFARRGLTSYREGWLTG